MPPGSKAIAANDDGFFVMRFLLLLLFRRHRSASCGDDGLTIFWGKLLLQLKGVRETHTYAVMEEMKNTTNLPICLPIHFLSGDP
ncbi:hypothetical protein [Herbaspirillum sp. ST 5-3]|uniref:hypothetical protein n=1 Tax=Oxalobacteraceae TaxID=75682 RepID=UPI0010A597D0|nr:hypothetical protein [Herbaspirillum sp. ST 5-3]